MRVTIDTRRFSANSGVHGRRGRTRAFHIGKGARGELFSFVFRSPPLSLSLSLSPSRLLVALSFSPSSFFVPREVIRRCNTNGASRGDMQRRVCVFTSCYALRRISAAGAAA